MHHRDPWVIYANFMSDLAVDLDAHDVLRQWATQAPRKIWLARSGDVLVTPTPLSDAFKRFACLTLGIAPGSVHVVTVPHATGLSMAAAVRRAGLLDELRALVAARPRAQLVPIALDRPTVELAADLHVPVAPYGTAGVPDGALDVTYRLNTKSGFRAVSARLGIRTPPGRSCRHDQLAWAVDELLPLYDRLVVKPDRSAGGHGLRFISRTQQLPSLADHRRGDWVIEQHLPVARSLSIQYEAHPDGSEHTIIGEMRVSHGSFTGFRTPPSDLPSAVQRELHEWGVALGHYLIARGYAGPYGIDAVLTADGTLFATESNIRRTATTTPHTMVTRLGHTAGLDGPAWMLGKGRSRDVYDYSQALEQLSTARLAWSPARKEGIVLYADAPADGRTWQYAAIAAQTAKLQELETRLADALDLT